MMENLNEVAEKLNNGDGTLSKLLNDKTLYTLKKVAGHYKWLEDWNSWSPNTVFDHVVNYKEYDFFEFR